MRYMMLIYSREDEPASAGQLQQVAARHAALMEEAARRGVLRAAEPLAPSSTATTVRVEEDRVILTDRPFAETKEQLAGYYIVDCEDLDEALEWAAKIPTGCQGTPGWIEVRPMREIRSAAELNG
jgi:hypothetical protein